MNRLMGVAGVMVEVEDEEDAVVSVFLTIWGR